MLHKNTLIDCYKTLNIATDIEWSELRKQYKKQAHKWHPDRYKENSKERQVANEKIKELTAAYQQLAKFYKKYGVLPTFETPPPIKKTPKPPPQPKRTPTTATATATAKPDTTTQTKSRFRHSVVVIIAAAVVTILLRGLPHIENKMPTTFSLKESEVQASYAKKPETESKIRKTKKARATFSYGAGIGEVISKQGAPDTVEGNTWFYGKSKINFINGRVSSWTHDPDDPLNVHLKKQYFQRAP